MKNAECTPLSPEEERELLSAFPQYLSEQDEALARRFFPQIVFFRALGRSARRCVCTSCLEGFTVDKAIRPDFFRLKHKSACECPNCGQRAELLAMGKYPNYASLFSRERAVQISVYKDWLLVQAGYVTRWFDHEDLGGYVSFEPFRRYAFAWAERSSAGPVVGPRGPMTAPGGRRAAWACRTVSWFGREWGTDGPWVSMKTVGEPFQSRPYEREAAYWLIGAEAVGASSLRYCQYGAWFDGEYGGSIGGLDWEAEPFRVAYLVRYLAEYTRRPQMELLVKLGYRQVVSDLVIQGKPHGDILDWNARDPAAFFRLTKRDFRLFRSGAGGFEDLKAFRSLHRAGLVRDLRAFAEEKARWGEDYEPVCKGARLAKVALGRAARYLQGFDGTPGVTAQLWADYLEAAVKLQYDLSRDDVRLPRDLAERHDQATAAVMVEEDEKAVRRYRARYGRLMEQFAFSADGLCVVAPKGVRDIVREGRILCHCVGGYADRHVDGRVTILFLRKEAAPGVPYVTIELSTENNCAELHIRQIHGYRNDLPRASPWQVHAGFLEKWLAWVHAGSPRDGEGRPVIRETREKEEVA